MNNFLDTNESLAFCEAHINDNTKYNITALCWDDLHEHWTPDDKFNLDPDTNYEELKTIWANHNIFTIDNITDFKFVKFEDEKFMFTMKTAYPMTISEFQDKFDTSFCDSKLLLDEIIIGSKNPYDGLNIHKMKFESVD